MDDHSRGWATPLPHHGHDRARALALPALLVAIASLGVYRSATLNQSTWQGASFGMFSTYDGPSRTVEVTVTRPGGPVRVYLPLDLRDDEDRLKVVPTDTAATRLARLVLERAGSTATGVEVVVWMAVLSQDDGLHLHIERLTTGTAP